MLLDLLYSEDIDIKDLEKYLLASSQGQAPRFSPKNFITHLLLLILMFSFGQDLSQLIVPPFVL